MRYLLILVMLGGVAWADGAIRGRVVDKASSEPAVGTTIIVTSPAMPGAQTAITDENGAYVVEPLPAGEYLVTAYYDDAVVERPGVRIDERGHAVVNLAIDTNHRSEVIVIESGYSCCGGESCSMPSSRRTFEQALMMESAQPASPEPHDHGAWTSEPDQDESVTRRGQLGLSARGLIGMRDISADNASLAVELEASYGVARHIELTLAGRIPLDDGTRWHLAPGVRVFATEHLFVQPQLMLPAFGLTLLEGVSVDLHPRVAAYVYAAQSVESGMFGLGGGLGVQARY